VPEAVTEARRRINLAVVLQPLSDLRVAASLAMRAMGQLAGGVVRLGWDLLRPGGAAPARCDGRAFG
jgi:hypothetical protein